MTANEAGGDQATTALLLMAAQLRGAGFYVTCDLLIDQHGYADLMGKSPKTILNWYHDLVGPRPFQIVRGRKLWRLADALAYRDDQSTFSLR